MIRRIDNSDIPEIHSICSHYIRNTTVTFGEEVPSLTGFGLVIQILHFTKKASFMIRVCHKMPWYQCKISLLCVWFWKPSIGICLCNWNSNWIIKGLRTHNWNINLRQERPFSKGYWEGPFISFATTPKRPKIPFRDRVLDHSQWTMCKITGTIWIQEMCWIQRLWLQIQSMAFFWILAINAWRLFHYQIKYSCFCKGFQFNKYL